MERQYRLAIAALLHDLPKVIEQTEGLEIKVELPILALAEIEDPHLRDILDRAERFTTLGDTTGSILTNQVLSSIFPKIQLDEQTERTNRYHSIAPLPATDDDQSAIFCNTNGDASGYSQQIDKLVEALVWVGENVEQSDEIRLYHHLFALLQRFTWCLPSHTADLSLFDHAKLTAAIAVCLENFLDPEFSIEILNDPDSEPFCLIVGDLSGIQDYIFDIANIGAGGVARRIRARSFYISALSDVVGHLVVDHFGLPLGNIIMASGGKFYVLASNRVEMASMLGDLRREIDDWFLKRFNGEIAVNLAYIPFKGTQFQAGSLGKEGFGDVLSSLSYRLNREKRQKGHGVLVRDGKWFEDKFMAKPDFWGAEICLSCRKFPGNQRDGLCEKCARDEDVGRKLPRTRFIAFYNQAEDERDAMPMPKGYSVRVLSGDDLSQVGNPYLVAQLNDPDIQALGAYPASFRYLANYVPLGKHGGQKTFEEIANQAKGRSLLGYIKADVDYLSLLFAQGLRRDTGGLDTAAHLAAISRELDQFFSGWIQHILSQNEDYLDFYTIFSGGDDLFLVGPWDKTSDLAQMVNERFAEFVGQNPDITLSAGVLFSKNRYPISRAAIDAEEELKKSKANRNQLTVLGDTLDWKVASTVFEEIEALQVRSRHLTSSFLHNLIEYGRMYRKWKREKDVVGLRYKPLFAYNIARNLRKGDEKLYQWADRLMQSLHTDRENLTMQYLGLIATYVLFARRERK